MPQRKMIGLPARETPAELKTTSGQRRPFPPDLLRQASRRLQILTLVGAGLWVLGPAFGHLAMYFTGNPQWRVFDGTEVICTVAVLISLGLYAYLRMGDRNPELVMNLGLAYMVVCTAAIGLMSHWGSFGTTPQYGSPMLSWSGPVILMFAALVPASPWKMVVAGFVAACMDPLGMMFAHGAGVYPHGGLAYGMLMHYPTFLLFGVAVVVSNVVTRLGRQVAKERELGSYRLGELLGQGGMGEVYKASHRMLARPAAIKLINPQVLAARDRKSAGVAVARFRREAEAAAQLRSPHTVELYDFGETEDGTLYFVMELLEGMDLESLVRKEGPLPQERVIHILKQVCESLEEAHVSGLVHRDIKPANIHVGRVGLRHDFVKVLDFGLVKSVMPGGEDSLATAAGLTPGTPAYMAPELALGEPCDGRADLYALGCVAYFLLTGHLVFDATNGLQMITKHLQETTVPPSRRSELPISPELEQVVLACLAKKPDQRPRTAAELHRMLDEIEIDPWSEEEATRWWQARRPVSHQPA